MAKKTYTVLTPVSHNNKDYAPGKSIDLDDDQAAPLLECKAIAQPAEEEASAKKGGAK